VDIDHRHVSVYLAFCELTGDAKASVIDEDIERCQLGNPAFDPSNVDGIGQISNEHFDVDTKLLVQLVGKASQPLPPSRNEDEVIALRG
jgi:hypothetical protein